ncbi:hypothetical protein NTGZN8_160070 [Candidatus Nitrotoga fabula]|uniref:Uncharacterized protein n=1 Tax=Candidatus Nitrotoga fabula TaxID=2182327 RepID=A0A916BBH2_9PROT|nr:hypothetical protein NTGZN8_160070 [Candidatus Nitrotoga fabula]
MRLLCGLQSELQTHYELLTLNGPEAARMQQILHREQDFSGNHPPLFVAQSTAFLRRT